VSQPKVFEFAKEIGMSPLALMDKIREWKIPVRSHMAELEPEVLEMIRSRLTSKGEPEPAPTAAKKKKVATKKEPAAGASAAGGKATAKKVAKKAAPPAPAAPANKVSKASKAAAAAAAEPVEEKSIDPKNKKSGVVVKKAADKVVVRRKTEEEEEAEALAAAEAAEEQALAASAKSRALQAIEEEPEVEVEEEIHAVVAKVTTVEPSAPEVTHSATASTAASASLQGQIATATVSSAPSAPIVSSPSPSMPGSGPSIARKREVVMTGSGPVSGVKSEPRRNIVGRMDLSRVAAPGSGPTPGAGGPGISRPGMPIPGAGDRGGSRPTFGGPTRPGAPGAGPRPLRAGFVASAPLEVEDEATIEARRRFDERKARTKPGAASGGPGTGAGNGKEEEVQSFTATEFRKREMVFQPKKKKGLLNRESMRTQLTQPKASKRVVKVNQTMKLSDLANELGIKAGQVTKALMASGVMATMNTDLDFDTIALIVPEFGFEALNVHRTVDQMIESTSFAIGTDADRFPRPPVVTIMGHVDHGKTSLLDVIRKANVAAGEAGGITQHIGAYQVTTESGALITFIDTPGHEAFTAMRARGANATDIAVIVVAADDGAMPQTVEAINHAKAAGVPIIVALNKMDKPGANPDKVKQQLTEQQLVPEEWGGDTIYVPVSAHTKAGIPELLEQIYLVAEVAQLTANPTRSATGLVIESRMDKGRGPVATLLVQDGTLEIGQSIVVGSTPGRVRGLINDKGERVKTAGPSVPVEILGLSEVPMAGDKFDVVVDDQAAESIANQRREAIAKLNVHGKISMEDIFSKLKSGDVKEFAIVLKTDVAGSSEAIKGMFDKIVSAEVKLKIVHSAVGGINESDVLLANTARGIVVGFNVRPDTGAQAAAKRLGTEVKTYTIVYELMDDMKKAMAGLLTPDIVEKQLGRAEVRNTFNVPKAGTIAGCFVTEGKITRNSEVRLLRESKIIYTGKLGSLKRFKDDAKEVASNFECGLSIENFNDIKVGDVVEAFSKESVVRELQ
jgi:translation initiation factor IF-2